MRWDAATGTRISYVTGTEMPGASAVSWCPLPGLDQQFLRGSGLLQETSSPVWQWPGAGKHLSHTGASTSVPQWPWWDSWALPRKGKNCLQLWQNTWAPFHQLRWLKTFNEMMTFFHHDKMGISRKCINWRRRNLDLPLSLHCQDSAHGPVYLTSLIFAPAQV